MFKEIFNLDSVALLSQSALVIFVVVFIATALWITTRPKPSVRQWASLPFEDDQSITPSANPSTVVAGKKEGDQ